VKRSTICEALHPWECSHFLQQYQNNAVSSQSNDIMADMLFKYASLSGNKLFSSAFSNTPAEVQ